MNKELYILLKRSLFSERDEEVHNMQITQGLFQEMNEHAIHVLPAQQLKQLNIEQDLQSEWKKAVYSNYQRYFQLMTVQQSITDLLGSNEIKAVILKGSSAAMYYPCPQNRVMGDIDILVKNELLEDARKLLVSNNFEQWDKSIDRHYCFEKSGIHIELHHHFSEIYGERTGSILR